MARQVQRVEWQTDDGGILIDYKPGRVNEYSTQSPKPILPFRVAVGLCKIQELIQLRDACNLAIEWAEREAWPPVIEQEEPAEAL